MPAVQCDQLANDFIVELFGDLQANADWIS